MATITLYDTTTKLKQIWDSFSNPSYRHAFVRSNIISTVAAQIFALRDKFGFTQKELADKCGMKQARISVLENATANNVTVDTLTRIASVFNVAVLVHFVPFSELAKWTANISDEKLTPTDFDSDSIAVPSVVSVPEQVPSLNRLRYAATSGDDTSLVELAPVLPAMGLKSIRAFEAVHFG